jgi:hypothetical protein
MEGSGSVEIITDPDPRGPKTYGFGSGTLPQRFLMHTVLYKDLKQRGQCNECCLFRKKLQKKEKEKIIHK